MPIPVSPLSSSCPRLEVNHPLRASRAPSGHQSLEKTLLLAVVFVLFVFVDGATLAQSARPSSGQAGDTSWVALTPSQQSALAPLQQQWASLDVNRRQQWIAVAERVRALPAEDRARLTDRMLNWVDLPASERSATRLQFQQAQAWSAQERSTRWDEYQSLHPDARKILAERWKREAETRAAAARTRSAAAKRNVVEVRSPPGRPPQAATPATVRAPAGATSTSMTAQPNGSLASPPGPPKIKAIADLVDPVTLLPRRGPQAARPVTPRAPADPPPQ